MSIALLAPLGLAALAAWALPILVHLVRRLQLERTEFAALRWIAVDAQPRRRIRFERPWLLFVRLLLLAALALLLAQPVQERVASRSAERAFVAPGVAPAAARAALGHTRLDLRWLAPSFPSLEQPLAAGAVPVASLLREADASLAADETLHVVVPRTLGGLDGERPRLAHTVDWRVVDGRSSASTAAKARPIRFAVRFSDADVASVRYLRAAVAAWNAREPDRYTLDAAPAAGDLPADARWLAWLAPSPPAGLDAWIERGGVALVTHDASGGEPLWRDADGSVRARVRRQGAGRVIALPDALSPPHVPAVLDARFADLLLDALRGAPRAPDRADADAFRPVQVERVAASGLAPPTAPVDPLDAWFAGLAALLFAIERVLATHEPRRAVA
ncbi:MAG TPA: BatA domain-containing protein [Dokdonella sp.]|nr:BatA domain-containing protein [Dokdonella sp.]